MRKIIFGVRQSRLAKAQLEIFIKYLAQKGVKIKYEIRTIRARGDRFKTSPIEELGQGIFIKELEGELLSKDIDCAVHSLKDVPVNVAQGTLLSSFVPRDDERDCLVCRRGVSPDKLKGKRLAIGSPRRRAFMLEREPDIEMLPLRGNIDTRIGKLEDGEFDAMILAGCGLKRIGYEKRISEYLDPDSFVPAAGQGAISAQTRFDDEELNEVLSMASCRDTEAAVISERKILKELGVGCRMPFGVFARFKEDKFHITAKSYVKEKAACFYYKLKGPRVEYEKITDKLIEKMKKGMRK